MSQNIQDDKYKRAVNFDLNTAELKKIFSSQSPLAYSQGYRQIGRILEKMRESSLLIEKNSAPVSVEQSDKEKSPAFINMQLLHDNAPIAQEIYEKSMVQQALQNKRSKNQEL